MRLSSACLLALTAALPAQDAPSPSVSDLDWLAGSWRGSDGRSDWESCYTSTEGGQIVGCSKEMRGGRTIMIDFEHFYARDGELRMTPYPFGTRSVEFTLTDLDRDARRAVFENPDHDFPKRFTYHRSGDVLSIELVGDMGEGPVTVRLELEPAGS